MDRTKSRLARIVSASTILGIALAAYGLRYIRASRAKTTRQGDYYRGFHAMWQCQLYAPLVRR